ncbi:hypothetical protein HPA02_12940 [Bisbaumannia pacifica]|uniref:Uncharacterized protein n=1 Tax=Bisbaumannia pacifica TaxID=77098 RepID=A0A510X7M9_9GAMM|nr:hypothetical protein [Halomonas pacifica]GEK47011.1 hypothetical protein HPA02_12940 [Halomonas pacifica]
MDAWLATLTLSAGYNTRLVMPPERAALLSSPKALAIVGAFTAEEAYGCLARRPNP